MPAQVLDMYVIYCDPDDYANYRGPKGNWQNVWIVRRWETSATGPVAKERIGEPVETMEQARALVPEYCTRIGRDFNDVPAIFEVWL
jgi:hypothetical protein